MNIQILNNPTPDGFPLHCGFVCGKCGLIKPHRDVAECCCRPKDQHLEKAFPGTTTEVQSKKQSVIMKLRNVQFIHKPSALYQAINGKSFVDVVVYPNGFEVCEVARCIIVNTAEYSRLLGLYVVPEARGESLASDLVEYACTQAVPDENPVYLEVDSFEIQQGVSGKQDLADGRLFGRANVHEMHRLTDAQLREFYQRHGFVPVPGHPFSLVRPARAPKS